MRRWPVIWLIQGIAMLVIGALLSETLWFSRIAYNVCVWACFPIFGAVSAYIATRKGLNNYLAWIAPPVMAALGHILCWLYPPDAGPVLLTALISLVGAAAGEVKNRQK